MSTLTFKRAPAVVGVVILDWLVDASPSRAGAVGGAEVPVPTAAAAWRHDPDIVANPRLSGWKELFSKDCC